MIYIRICKINERPIRCQLDLRLAEHGSRFQIDLLFVAQTRHRSFRDLRLSGRAESAPRNDWVTLDTGVAVAW